MELRCNGNSKLRQIKSAIITLSGDQSGRGIWDPDVVIATPEM